MITRIEVCYYAKCSQTGEIWETLDFKALYKAVKRSFKADIFLSHYYDYRGAVLNYGLVIFEDDGSFRYESYKEVGYISVSGSMGRITKCEIERW